MEKATVFGPGAADRVGGGVEVNDYISIPPTFCPVFFFTWGNHSYCDEMIYNEYSNF